MFNIENVQQRLNQLNEQLRLAKETTGSVLAGFHRDQDRLIQKLIERFNHLRSESEQKLAQFQSDAQHERQIYDERLKDDIQKDRQNLLNMSRQYDCEVAPQIGNSVSTDDFIGNGQVRRLIRIGRAHTPLMDSQNPLGAYIPLLDSGHLLINGSISNVQVQTIIKNIVGKALLSAPPGQLEVVISDPTASDILVGYSMESSGEKKTIRTIGTSRADLEETLHEFDEFRRTIANTRAGQYSCMSELIEKTGQQQYPYRLLVLLNSESQLSEEGARALERLIGRGSENGISILLHWDQSRVDPDDYSRLTQLPHDISNIPTIAVDRNNSVTLRYLPDKRPLALYSLEKAPSNQAQRSLISAMEGEAKHRELPTVHFEKLVPEIKSESSAEGMVVSLGAAGMEKVAFTLGDTRSNLHNVLIGGSVGTGKTNLLKVIIYSLASRYAADELEMFLLDFKEGVEFNEFAGDEKSWPLANARVVSTRSDVAFGLATLEYLLKQVEIRSELFKAHNVENLEKYRKLTEAKLPRLLLVVDEFQAMFQGESNERATELLEDLARKGRAYGIHIILSSQTLSGIRFAGGKDAAIFAQFPVRVVLNLPKNESQIFLGSGNIAAANLRYRGQAVLNTANGREDDNRVFLVALADSDDIENRKRKLLDNGEVKPRRVYSGDEAVSLREIPRPVPDFEKLQIEVVYGQQSTVDALPASTHLAPRTGNHILVAGHDVKRSLGSLQAMTLTAAASAKNLGRNLEIIFLNGMLGSEAHLLNRLSWNDALERFGAEVTWFGIDEVEVAIQRVHQSDRSVTTLFVIVGGDDLDLEYAFEELQHKQGPLADDIVTDPESDDPFADAEVPFTRSVHQTVPESWEVALRKWPRSNTHVLGYWTSPLQMPRLRDYAAMFRTQVYNKLDRETIMQASGIPPAVQPAVGDGKLIVFDALSSQRGMSIVTAIKPLDDELFEAW